MSGKDIGMDFGFASTEPEDPAPKRGLSALDRIPPKTGADAAPFDVDAVRQVNREQGFVHPGEAKTAVARKPARKPRKAAPKPAPKPVEEPVTKRMPMIGKYTADKKFKADTPSTLTIHGPARVKEMFEKIKAEYDDEASWVILHILCANYFKHTPEDL